MNYKLITILCASLIGVLIPGYYLYNYLFPDKFFCDSTFILHKNGYKMPILISYYFQGKTGMVMINGALYMPDGEIVHIDRKTVFTYHKSGNMYFLESISSHSIIPEEMKAKKVLATMLPLFYLRSEINYSINIYPQAFRGWIFSSERVPNFYCIKNGLN